MRIIQFRYVQCDSLFTSIKITGIFLFYLWIFLLIYFSMFISWISLCGNLNLLIFFGIFSHLILRLMPFSRMGIFHLTLKFYVFPFEEWFSQTLTLIHNLLYFVWLKIYFFPVYCLIRLSYWQCWYHSFMNSV